MLSRIAKTRFVFFLFRGQICLTGFEPRNSAAISGSGRVGGVGAGEGAGK